MTSDSIHAATHHWYWVDTVVHVLVAIMVIVVAARMKLMDVANLPMVEEGAKEFITKNYLGIASSKKLIKNS